ncbi:MAG: KpsF/GutQ family sugar-phosphate isomerase [Methylococcaceae bacterium]|nr:KpsF/GutQ family sugar-phosphate isomerase [Methylococcaceae bacterium]MCI0667125.1 KpsF/GutQ family sugar-phosphate isomerase [Methylococcaceae bacterium]MCI0734619.1 KpsF/GutQ family sugar-phosphate isomerase [Methylococcaceae bacterium]
MTRIIIDESSLIALGREVIDIETRAVAALRDRVDESFVQACRLLLDCRGRIVVTGMGKSGHIGGKIAATLASTGNPAFFVHPGEAGHGDLGMITREDTVLALSNSGETPEILTILPMLKRLGIPLVAMTGARESTLAREASVHLDVRVVQEACPLGLAPTSSTTAALVMGDALAVSLLKSKGFTRDDFARSHPGGRLGKRLLLKTGDLMHSGSELPSVGEQALVREALIEMTAKKLGMTAIVDRNNFVKGIFTDGDLRRMFDKTECDVHTTRIQDVMTANCATISPEMMAAEALQKMEQKKITVLLVTDAQNRLIGALHMHDLLLAGVV